MCEARLAPHFDGHDDCLSKQTTPRKNTELRQDPHAELTPLALADVVLWSSLIVEGLVEPLGCSGFSHDIPIYIQLETIFQNKLNMILFKPDFHSEI